MKILIYSTNSNHFSGELKYSSFPARKEQLRSLSQKYPDFEFIIATQMPGMFILDGDEFSDGKESFSPSGTQKIRYVLIKHDEEAEIAEFLSSFEPDAAVAASFFVKPFDWLSIKDALIAEFLRRNGIKTLCHSVDSSVICFDKWRTHCFLRSTGINTAKAVYIHHSLFINAGNRKEIKSNIYKKSVRFQLENMKYPVVIKDTVGFSSYGMEVCKNFDEAWNFLHSKRNTSDRIAEEFIEGLQFGTEIHGSKGNYRIFDPFIFSTNKYGITSPKQSVKLGPVTDKKFKISELKKMLSHLAEKMEFNGIAQVDLVFSQGKWFVIEINPRLSGMSSTYAACYRKTIFEFLAELAEQKREADGTQTALSPLFTLNIKFPLMDEKRLKKLAEFPFVAEVSQTENLKALQEREKGYCEAIITSEKSFQDLMKNLTEIKAAFPAETEIDFFRKAEELTAIIS